MAGLLLLSTMLGCQRHVIRVRPAQPASPLGSVDGLIYTLPKALLRVSVRCEGTARASGATVQRVLVPNPSRRFQLRITEPIAADWLQSGDEILYTEQGSLAMVNPTAQDHLLRAVHDAQERLTSVAPGSARPGVAQPPPTPAATVLIDPDQLWSPTDEGRPSGQIDTSVECSDGRSIRRLRIAVHGTPPASAVAPCAAVCPEIEGVAYQVPYYARTTVSELQGDGAPHILFDDVLGYPQLGPVAIASIAARTGGRAKLSVILAEDGSLREYRALSNSYVDKIINKSLDGIGGLLSRLLMLWQETRGPAR